MPLRSFQAAISEDRESTAPFCLEIYGLPQMGSVMVLLGKIHLNRKLTNIELRDFLDMVDNSTSTVMNSHYDGLIIIPANFAALSVKLVANCQAHA